MAALPPGMQIIMEKNGFELVGITEFEDVLKYVDAVAPSLECPYTNFSDIARAGLGTLISDLCGSGFLVLGSTVPINQSSDLSINNEIIEIMQGEYLVEIGSTKQIIGSPIQSLFHFLNLAYQNKLDLKKGQWIATGGCTSCVELNLCTDIRVSFSGLGAFNIRINQL